MTFALTLSWCAHRSNSRAISKRLLGVHKQARTSNAGSRITDFIRADFRREGRTSTGAVNKSNN